jgi:hypothetical protein
MILRGGAVDMNWDYYGEDGGIDGYFQKPYAILGQMLSILWFTAFSLTQKYSVDVPT